MATATKRKRDALGRYLPAAKKKTTRNRVRGGHSSRKKVFKRIRRARTKKPVTHIAFLLDNSGSMACHRDAAKLAFNEIIKPIKEQAKQKDQKLRVSYYTFGVNARKVFFESTAESLKPLISYYPNEFRTALYEAIQLAIREFDRLDDANDSNSSFLIQIVTDGGENVHNFGAHEIQQMIQTRQETDRWTFAISCPQDYVAQISEKLGIYEGNIHGWDPRNRFGMRNVSAGHSVGLKKYLCSRGSGQSATKKFFAEVNVGKQGVRTVKRGLKAEPASRFRRLTVDKARSVKDFIESKNLLFQKGRVFYSLSKKETVQPFKEILLQKRNEPKVFYGGSQVREKLGIPAGKDAEVSPGNLGDWIIWIQSTSSNRKFLAKMHLLYDTSATVKNGRN